MLRTVHLHGRLGERFGKRFELDVESPAEAVKALIYQRRGFEQYIRHRNYVVTAGRSPNRDECPALSDKALQLRLGHSTDIHIVPAPLMPGVEWIILGVTLALIAVSTVVMLSMMRAPKPGEREEATKVESHVFDGPENVIEQGHPMPLIYGEVRTGSVVVSSSIMTADTAGSPVGGDSGTIDPGNVTPEGGAGGGTIGTTPGTTPGFDWDDPVDIVLFGGGGKSGGTTSPTPATEAPNSLLSNATAKVLEAIGEGEIVGLVNGMKSVYLDNTPLQNTDGTFNFQGAVVEQRVGLPDQDYISGFTSAETTIDVDTEVKVSLGPVTRTITDATVTAARVTIRVPALYQQDTTTGDIGPTSVAVKISVQTDGGGFTDVYTMTITGKTNRPYDRSVNIFLPAGTTRDIRVTRLTADSAASSLVNVTRWQLLTEIIEAKLSYPDTALIGLTVDARQFGNSIPSRSYHVKGLIIEVPTNYNPSTRVYTGVWNGTFKRAWTDNPAWILRDLIVNRRYGLGARIASTVPDKWALYSIAQYCDELIPTGFGGTAPRYRLNTVIRSKVAAYDLIAAVASNFRGWVYWSSGSIVPAMDRPEDPTVLVTRSNVVDGLINYGRVTPHERRRSVAVVYWNDPKDGYKLVPEIVEDPVLVRRFGRRTGEEVTAFGVTNRGQAHRLARFILEDESEGSNTVADYSVGDDHAFAAPARIAMVADPMFTQSRRGGRVVTATAGTVEIDETYTFVTGQVYTLRTILPDGVVSVRPITNGAGAATVVTLGGTAWTTPPNSGAVWTIETDVVANRQFRIRAIETDRPPYRVKAVLHDPTKYARVELDRDLDTPDYISLPSGPLKPPTQLGIFEYLEQEGTAWVPSALFSWQPAADARVMFFQAQAKGPTGDWFDLGDSLEPTRTVRPAAAGTWNFRVRAVDGLGRTTAWQTGSAILDGQADLLPEVVAPGITIDDELLSATLIWDKPADTRPLRYEIMYSAGGAYGTAVSLGTTDQLTFPITQQGNYWVRTTFIGQVSPAPVLVNASALIFSSGIVPHLTRETVALPASSAGVVSSYAAATGTFKVFSGATDISANFTLSTPVGGNPEALTHSYTGLDYAVTAGFDAGEATAQLRIRATGSGLYAGVVLDKDFTLVKAVAGVSAIVGFLTNESTTLAAANDGTVSSFATAAGQFRVFDGLAEVTGAAVTYSVFSQTGCTVAIDAAGNYSVSAMSADNATATLRAVYGGVTIDKVLSLAKSRAGAVGETGAAAKTITLISDRQVLYVDSAGTYDPSVQTTTFTVEKSNTTAAAVWSITDINGVAQLATLLTSQTGSSASLSRTNFETARNGTTGVIVAATVTDGVTLTDKISVLRVQQGATGPTGPTGNYRDVIFKRSRPQPATPTGDNPAGWSNGVPAGINEMVWMSVATKTAAGVLVGTWSMPEALGALAFRGAYLGTETYYLNETVTHNGRTYMALQNNFTGQAPSGTDVANLYWDVIAARGRTGDQRDIRFLRSNAQPATPTGDDPAGWVDGVPAGTATVWQSVASKDAAGVLIGSWSVPEPIQTMTARGAYESVETYYLSNTVTFNGGTYIALQDNFTGQAPSGDANATAYWDVLAAPGAEGEPATPPSAFSATINLTSGAAKNLRTFADAAGYTGSSDATITFKVPNAVVIRGLSGGGIGIDTGTWPTGYTIALTLVVENGGIVDGGGGNGGAASAGVGGAGGHAIYLRVNMTGGITINLGGTVRGGGGGGKAGTNSSQMVGGEPIYYGGSGGGGGFPNGTGGSGYGTGFYAENPGNNGAAGTTSGGGAGGAINTMSATTGGSGGAAGTAGGGPGGAAGNAVKKNGKTATVTNNGTMIGATT